MYFSKVEFTNFRNLNSTSITPSKRLNLISGANGSGKSSLLEALYFLSLGSSFRTHRFQLMIQHGFDCFTLFCKIGSDEFHQFHRIGLTRCKGLNHQTRIDGEPVVRRSSLVQLLPLQIISPESINLLLDGSDLRRAFLDWSLFHVKQSFHYHSSSYNRALKQRNALLRSNSHYESLEQWNNLLSLHGQEIDAMRKNHLSSFSELIHEYTHNFLPHIQITFEYRPGWPKESNLNQALDDAYQTDLKLKHTTVGPHRADVSVKVNGQRAVDVLSRGQLKLVVVAMKLAQIHHLVKSFGRSPVILVDDLAAELDCEHRSLFIETLSALQTQVFMTTPDLSLIEIGEANERKVFHVEHGKIEEVV